MNDVARGRLLCMRMRVCMSVYVCMSVCFCECVCVCVCIKGSFVTLIVQLNDFR